MAAVPEAAAGRGSAPTGSAAPVRPGGCVGNKARDPQGLEEPFNIGGDPKEPPLPGPACHALQGPLGPAAEGCGAGFVPVLLGADPELCSGPGLFPFLSRGWKEWDIAKPDPTSPVSRSPAAPE